MAERHQSDQITVANITTRLIHYQNAVVATTKQLAQFYECDPHNLRKNFNENKDRFEEGKHYFRLTGKQVDDFVRLSPIVTTEIPEATTVLFLWTERGAARHAKMLSTDKAWEVFEQLEDVYFRVKQMAPELLRPKQATNPLPHVKAHMAVATAMEKLGVRKEMAMAVALKAIHEDTGMTTEGYRLALPSVEDIGTLNQTQLGELIGISSREMGKRLRDADLMVVDESGTRVPTEKGLQFGEVKPYKAPNGHTGYEIRWNKSVLEFLSNEEASHE